MEPFAITAAIQTYPTHPYQEMKDAILGKKYALSLAFIGPKKARALNKTHRQKDYVPNVLSFPLSKEAGEVCITLSVAKKEAAKFNMSFEGYVGFLFIHALLHLKGYDHGDTMDKAERRYCKKYALR